MYYDTGFTLAPRGDLEKSFTLDSVASQAIGTYQTYLAVRPQKNLTGDGSYFFRGMGGSHELKFGFTYRDMKTHSATLWSGNQLAGYINSATNIYARVERGVDLNYGGKYGDVYVGDMFTKDRFTFNIGVRFDDQTATNLESQAPANAAFPDLLPSAVFGGSDDDLQDWNKFSPRVGLSYALDESRRTIVRASYARYYEQLAFGNVTRENPTSAGYIAYGWNDSNGDRYVQPGEIDFSEVRYSSAVNVANPGSVSADTVNKIDRDRKPRKDDEFIVGLDRELGASFAAGVAFTYRKQNDWSDATYRCGPLQRSAESDDGQLPADGQSATTRRTRRSGRTATRASRTRRSRSRHCRPQRPPAHEPRRLLDHLQGARGDAQQAPVEQVDGPRGVHVRRLDAERRRRSARTATRPRARHRSRDRRQPRGRRPGRARERRLRQGRALLHRPDVAAVRERSLPAALGHRRLRHRVGPAGRPEADLPEHRGRPGRHAAVAANSTIDAERYGNVWDFDLRLAKTFRFGKQPYLTLAAEWFNVANSGQVLVRSRQANSAAYNRIDEVLNPSTFRLGATFGF